MRVLGVETSCDDTGIAFIEAGGDFGSGFSFKVLGNALSSQAKLHEQYGGVFPAMAKREHAKNLVPMLASALREAGALKESGSDISPYEAELPKILEREPELLTELVPFLKTYERPDVDAIAVTHGPGLEPCLWVGINFARALSAAWSVPVVPVDHMEGHLVMSMMEGGRLAEFGFPVLVLLVSGGHTELVLMREFGRYEIIGKTRDDAAGEAFDKVARILGLPYPGGPEISRLAAEARAGDIAADFKLPRPMLSEDNFDFSFSGLKTAVLRLVEAHKGPAFVNSLRPGLEEFKMQVAREFEDAVTETLVEKTLRAVEEHGVNAVVTGGGVSANAHIRAELARRLSEMNCRLLVCPPEFSTDNGLMIALSGYFRAMKKEFADPAKLVANGSLKLGEKT